MSDGSRIDNKQLFPKAITPSKGKSPLAGAAVQKKQGESVEGKSSHVVEDKVTLSTTGKNMDRWVNMLKEMAEPELDAKTLAALNERLPALTEGETFENQVLPRIGDALAEEWGLKFGKS